MSSEAKHTPGPWKYGVRSDRSIWISLGGEAPGPHYQFDWYGSEADARVATAAPDLLAIAKRIEAAMDSDASDDPLFAGMQRQLLDAIAKAEAA